MRFCIIVYEIPDAKQGNRVNRKEVFFFEKKNQKTFALLVPREVTRAHATSEQCATAIKPQPSD
jgi:hypothetical protein